MKMFYKYLIGYKKKLTVKEVITVELMRHNPSGCKNEFKENIKLKWSVPEDRRHKSRFVETWF